MSNKKTYFIDVENVGSKTIARFLTHDKNSDVVVVTGPHSNFQASGAVLEELSKGKNSRVDVIHTDISRDQLADKLLLIKVGEFHGRFPNRTLIIVSKDKGFQDAAKIMNAHWGSNIQTITELPLPSEKSNGAKKQPAKTQPAKAQPAKAQPATAKQSPKQNPVKGGPAKYWEIISKRAVSNRPKTIDALNSSIANIKKTGIDAQPDKVVSYLKSQGKISVKNGKVTWLD